MEIPEFMVIVADRQVSLFPIVFYQHGLSEDLHKFAGVNMKHCLMEFKEGKMRWCCTPEEWKALGDAAYSKTKNEHGFFEWNCREVEKHCNGMASIAEKAWNSDLKGKTNRELLDFYDAYGKEMRLATASGLTFSFIDAVNDLLTKELKQKLERAHKEKLSEVFTLLTTPNEESFLKKERKGLLKLGEKIQNEKPELLKLKPKELVEKLDDQLKKEFDSHYRAYFWLPYNYEGPAWSKENVASNLLALAKKGFTEQLQQIEKEELELNEQQKEGEKKLDAETRELIRKAKKIVYLKGLRKELFFKSYCLMEPWLRETAKRFGYSLKQVRFLDTREVEALLLENKKVPEETLNARYKHCVHYAHDARYGIFTGKEAEYASSRIIEEKAEKEDELKGECAYPGKAKGTVKVINELADLKKMKKGDIIVSIQTNVNLVPAMELSTAIVTDIGGITCHAAIVSRELKIPCVIGTRVATKTLKDGDVVEVDATKGIVRKI
ncbi:hypothetical protein HZC09_02760 [Candidatus Micrarchaeota archaeon]|nr:hypothetical protein [Candidatus Micrarchaeota archaeon]